MPNYPFFEVTDVHYAGHINTVQEKRECTVDLLIRVNGNSKFEHVADQGVGVVDAADKAMRKAVRKKYPDIDEVVLIDFSDQALNVADKGSSAEVQTTIKCQFGKEAKKFIATDPDQAWSGVLALIKAYNYFLAKKKNNS